MGKILCPIIAYMATPELTEYKTLKKNEIYKTYHDLTTTIASALSHNIQIVKHSNTSDRTKTQRIQFMINQYKQAINRLKDKYVANITKIDQMQPVPIVINKNKKALLVGINYEGTGNELYGCINDVASVKSKLETSGFSITTLTDATSKKPTKQTILSEFKKLLINSSAGDLLVFMYSGHGSYVPDKNGDEPSGVDQVIVPLDLDVIVDDDLKHLIVAHLKKNVTLFALFDCCFSGSVLDLRYHYMDSLNYNKFTENPSHLETQGNALMISGCTDEQYSMDSTFDGKSNGAMTWAFLKCLTPEFYASNKNTWRELMKQMRDLLKKNKYDQIPQFSSGLFVNMDTKVFI